MRDFLYDMTAMTAMAAFVYGLASLLLGAH